MIEAAQRPRGSMSRPGGSGGYFPSTPPGRWGSDGQPARPGGRRQVGYIPRVRYRTQQSGVLSQQASPACIAEIWK
ncbi:hypothetical protein GQ53DRAFT_741755 [Thozetella sp. PMI_491]|nr:hypothetical protein GQ53DRAFT_741755 [Thozetella sp. PMI_491]